MSSIHFFAAFFIALVASPVAMADINFNCPSVTNNAVVRLRPCYNNKLVLGYCDSTTNYNCGSSSLALLDPTVTGFNTAAAEWKISTTSDGLVTLMLEGQYNNNYLDSCTETQTFPNGMTGFNGLCTNQANMLQPSNKWCWDLRPDNAQCRVLLKNSLHQLRLGLISNNGPATNNGFPQPLVTYQPISQNGLDVGLTLETWEVEFVRMDSTGYGYN